MRRTNKKGFTIVELVIVIAVIAILAAVLIPTFSHLVNEANLSADQVAVKNMNTALKIYEAEHGKPNYYEMRQALSDAGFNAGEDLKPVTANHKFLWNSDENEMMLVEVDESGNEKAVYPKNYSSLTIDHLKHNNIGTITAYVEKTNNTSVTTDSGKIDLECSFKFAATDDADTAALSEYAKWRAEFTVSFDKDIDVTEAGQIYLAGQYTTHSDNWVQIDPYQSESYRHIAAGTEIDLLSAFLPNWAGMFNYEQVCKSVGEFNCGAWANGNFTGTTMRVELRLYKPTGEIVGDYATDYSTTDYIVAFVYEYTFQ